MSQISPPIRIVLGAAIAFLAVYMVFLRPKTDATPAPAPAPAGNVATGKPAVTGIGKTVESAKGAVAAANGSSAATATAANAAGATATGADTGSAAATANGTAKANSSTPPATTASAKATGLPLPLLKAVAKHKVLALLFWNPKSADDRLVHSALKHVDRFGGEVFVHAAPLSKVSRYARITRGADVQQSPTVVVVDRKLRSTNLVGYVDTVTIQQAVVDSLRASGGLYKTDYLKRVNATCSDSIHSYTALPQSTTPGQGPKSMRRHTAVWDGFVKSLRGTPAPAKLRGFHRTFLADAVAIQNLLHDTTRTLGAHPSAAHYSATLASLDRKSLPLEKRFNRHADAKDLVFCGTLG